MIYISTICNVGMMSERVLLSEFPVWSDRPLSYVKGEGERGGVGPGFTLTGA